MIFFICLIINIAFADDFDFVREDDITINEGILVKKTNIIIPDKTQNIEAQTIKPKKVKRSSLMSTYLDEINQNQREDFNLHSVSINDLAQTGYPDGNEVFEILLPGNNLQTYLRNDLVSLSHKAMPVTVELRDGGGILKGGYLIGETYLDTISRSPVIMFNKLSLENGMVLNLKASGQFSDINKKCEYSSNKGKIFGLNLLMAATSGWLNSQIPTDRGVLGSLNVQKDNTFKTQTIQGVSEATRTISNELVDEFKKSGAFSICKGKRFLEVSVLESPNI